MVRLFRLSPKPPCRAGDDGSGGGARNTVRTVVVMRDDKQLTFGVTVQEYPAIELKLDALLPASFDN